MQHLGYTDPALFGLGGIVRRREENKDFPLPFSGIVGNVGCARAVNEVKLARLF